MKLSGRRISAISGRRSLWGYHFCGGLGSGRFGQCYLVSRDGTEYVLKVFNPNDVKRRKEKLALESKWLKHINHPAIPKLVETIYHDGIYGFVMEKMPGNGLEDLLNWGYVFSRKEILTIMTQLIQVMHDLTGLNISHHDIKTANILWDKDKLSLIDFGSARKLSHLNHRFKPDFWGIGDVFMRLALSSEDMISDPNNLSVDGLRLNDQEKSVILRLLHIEKPYDNSKMLFQDFMICFGTNK